MPQCRFPILATLLILRAIRHVLLTTLYFRLPRCHICWCRSTEWSSPLCPLAAFFICTLFSYIVHTQLATLFTQTQLLKQKCAWDHVDNCLFPISLAVEVLRGKEGKVAWRDGSGERCIALGLMDHPSLSTASRKHCPTISWWPHSLDSVHLCSSRC